MAKKMVRLGKFIEDPDNVSEATPEEIERLAGKLRRVPMGLTAMRIAYVTDSPGGWMVVSGNKRLRCLKAAYGENGEVPAEWFQDITAMSEDERHEFRLNANISDGHFNIEKLLAQYDLDELNAAGLEDLLEACDAENQPKDGETDPDAVPETPEEPVSERGKIYQCGEHLLMCGDSTSAEDMDRLLAGGGGRRSCSRIHRMAWRSAPRMRRYRRPRERAVAASSRISSATPCRRGSCTRCWCGRSRTSGSGARIAAATMCQARREVTSA